MSLFPQYIIAAKPAKPAKLSPTFVSGQKEGGRLLYHTEMIPIAPFPEWQDGFCLACADFNNWRGCCPKPLDDCLISRIINSRGSLNSLKGLEVGQGITMDEIINCWMGSNEPIDLLINNPVWIICMAEYLKYA